MEIKIQDVNVQKGFSMTFLNAKVSVNTDIIVGWSYDKNGKPQLGNCDFYRQLKRVEKTLRKEVETLARAKFEEIKKTLVSQGVPEKELNAKAMKEMAKRLV